MAPLTPLAKITIILSWLRWDLPVSQPSSKSFGYGLSGNRNLGLLISVHGFWVALVIGIFLVAQTTWAILDEGSGRHQSDMSQRNIAAVAKANNTVADML